MRHEFYLSKVFLALARGRKWRGKIWRSMVVLSRRVRGHKLGVEVHGLRLMHGAGEEVMLRGWRV